MTMKLPDGAHTSQPWRIHAIAPDFRLEDVWLLPETTDLRQAVSRFTRNDPTRSSSPAVRALFALRARLGALFGWDDIANPPSLRDRVPAELVRSDLPPAPPFSPL